MQIFSTDGKRLVSRSFIGVCALQQCFLFLNCMILKKMVHTKCRGQAYPFSEVKRLLFSDDLVAWSKHFPDYNPPEYNSKSLLNKPWADPPLGDPNFKPKWNELDGNVNRKSHTGTYNVVDGRPLNPEGRTGLMGRGILGKWGPNHAADPIVTRWKMTDNEKELNASTKFVTCATATVASSSAVARSGGVAAITVSPTTSDVSCCRVGNRSARFLQLLRFFGSWTCVDAWFQTGVDFRGACTYTACNLDKKINFLKRCVLK
ncbi:unnamed protein product [Callosobruchus maculatus]|uniref:ADP-ribose pyrophosphatase, mitochondrial n=1 Tax=Callosobruchus maculatus TaxID=64391 RepID=A0A653BHG7_CALMS|nr:unnamed protein product [Callosobruchus maculatus]